MCSPWGASVDRKFRQNAGHYAREQYTAKTRIGQNRRHHSKIGVKKMFFDLKKKNDLKKYVISLHFLGFPLEKLRFPLEKLRFPQKRLDFL